jgi:hypothetical protein
MTQKVFNLGSKDLQGVWVESLRVYGDHISPTPYVTSFMSTLGSINDPTGFLRVNESEFKFVGFS